MECICNICDCGLHRCPNEPLSLKTDDCMRRTTEYTKTFQSHGECPRVAPIKQKENLNKGSGGLSIGGWGLPFYGVTSNSLDFYAHPVQQRIIRPNKKYMPATEPMETNTSYKRTFLGIPLESKTMPVQTINNLKTGSGPMEVSSTYCREFIPKRIKKCPASCITMTGYKFKETNLGHAFYVKESI